MSIDYSIIIPAYNEEEFLPATLKSVERAMAAQDLTGEVIVVDNNSSDETAAIAAKAGAIVVTEAINQISRARNTGARVARGGYLIFLDADTTLTAELLGRALALLTSGKTCGGGVRVIADRSLPVLSEQLMEFWNGVSLRFGLAAGCFIFCLREGFNAVGGFSEKVYASEEIWFSRRLRNWGRRRRLAFEIITDPAIVTSMRKLQWYTTAYMLGYLLMFSMFPLVIFFRGLCRPWYDRPREKKSEE